MQYRFFDGDTEFWDKEEINLSAQELKKRFGIKNDKINGVENEEKMITENDVIVPTDIETAHNICAPEFDIYDQELANKQFADFISAGDKKGDGV